MNEFEDYMMPSITDVPDEILAQWAEEVGQEEYWLGINEYIDSELENEYYAQLDNEYYFG